MKKVITMVAISSVLLNCATHKPKITKADGSKYERVNELPEQSFLLVGNLAGRQGFDLGEVLSKKSSLFQNLDENTTVLFLGNSISPSLSKKNEVSKDAIGTQVGNQKELLKDHKGNALFIPGQTEWKDGVEWLERIEDEVDESFGKNSFLPENACPLDSKAVGDKVMLITVDSQWYLNDWNKYPKINDKCEIKDREKFFVEFESLIKKNTDKILIIAMHHPVMSNGNNGGQYSLSQNLTPLPVLGTIKTTLLKTGGFPYDHQQNPIYRSFRKRLVTLARFNEKVIFVSSHENNLQHIFEDDIHQIISGSFIERKPVRLGDNGRFAYGDLGFVKINVYGNGSTHALFYDVEGNQIHDSTIFSEETLHQGDEYTTSIPQDTSASIYALEATDKSGFHKWLWGERYRRYYSQPVTVPAVNLDTLLGGMTVLRKGGGHQSISLRLKSRDGREFVMRALEKSAESYLQAIVSKEEYIIGKAKGTAPERILKDFYTGSHPYAPFVVGKLADAIDIYHTNPMLCYIPKQKVLGRFNEEFGDQLFMIEERVTSGHGKQKSFGYADKIIGTDDLIARLASDEKYKVDLDSYVRARLFDMLLGDWDRHDDQWRWAEFKDVEEGKVIYRPIPRDRDQVFSIMGDGFLMGIATRAIPSLKIMEGYAPNIRSVRGFNSSPKTFSLDMLLLPETTLENWVLQAEFIQNRIDEKIVDDALQLFPKEIQDETTNWIKNSLLARKSDLVETAKEYYAVINKISVVIGTEKDDHFQIEDLGEGQTKVEGFRIKGGKKTDLFFSKVYDRDTTKEIRVYGLDDDDVFVVKGNGERGPRIRLIGGQNNDVYQIGKRKKVFVYDYKSQKNTFDSKNRNIKRTDDYDTNTYNPFNLKSDQNLFLPFIGYNPDDGIQLTATNTYTHNGFEKDPYTNRHQVRAGFYFATSGVDISYQGDFVRFLGTGALRLKARFTSPNFASNFFGFGNETPNFDDDLDLDFNRVKIESYEFEPSLVWRGRFGSVFGVGFSYENVNVEETENRFIETFYEDNTDLDNENDFLGIHAEYAYENLNNKAFPTLGLSFSVKSGYKRNISEGEDGFGYLIPELSLHYPLLSSGGLVFSTKLGGQVNIGDDFQFFQGASIGAENGLRGYRFQRFTGKRSFYHSSDIKIVTSSVRTGVLPLYLGVYGGFDYGRVWVADDQSNRWNNSFGGGFFINGVNVITLQAGLFNSDDGNRLTVGFSVGF